MSEWLDNSNNANCFKSMYVNGFVDVSGIIISREPTLGLVLSGDASFNAGLSVSGDTSFNNLQVATSNRVGGIKIGSNLAITDDGILSGTNGVYTTGDQTIDGTKTFSTAIIGSVTGNAGTVTNGVYTTGTQTITGAKIFHELKIGNAANTKWTITQDGSSLMIEHNSNGNGTTVYINNNLENGSNTVLNVDGPVYLTRYLSLNNTTSYIDFNDNDEILMYAAGNKQFSFGNDGIARALNWTSTSDIRLKRNITPLTDALQTIMKLKPVNYEKRSIDCRDSDLMECENTDYITEDGFIAQDIQIIPELAHSVSHSESSDILGLNYNGIISYLVKAMQEQQSTIQEQQSIIEAQKDSLLSVLQRLEAAGI